MSRDRSSESSQHLGSLLGSLSARHSCAENASVVTEVTDVAMLEVVLSSNGKIFTNVHLLRTVSSSSGWVSRSCATPRSERSRMSSIHLIPRKMDQVNPEAKNWLLRCSDFMLAARNNTRKITKTSAEARRRIASWDLDMLLKVAFMPGGLALLPTLKLHAHREPLLASGIKCLDVLPLARRHSGGPRTGLLSRAATGLAKRRCKTITTHAGATYRKGPSPAEDMQKGAAPT